MNKPRLAAAILAGGRGERLGGANKALLEIDGRRMLDRVIAAIGDVEPILVCAGPNSLPGDPQFVTIADLPTEYAGPLAGVAAAAAALAGAAPDLLLTVAVDTPFFPADFAERAIAMLVEGSDVAVAAFGSQNYPTNAIWRFEALASLPARLADGTAPHSLRRLIDAHRSTTLDYARSGPENPFANANTPEDLAALRRAVEARKRG